MKDLLVTVIALLRRTIKLISLIDVRNAIGSAVVRGRQNMHSLSEDSLKRQRGSSLLEVLVATAILGVISTVFLTTISSGLMASASIEKHSVAENLIQTQIADIRNMSYSIVDHYPVTVSPCNGCITTVDVSDISPAENPGTLQKVVIEVCFDGRTVMAIETFKANL
ncbi:prepilin-type N-terminal cleavage/methylation domain-containing protein [Chloroflexota bacterium]